MVCGLNGMEDVLVSTPSLPDLFAHDSRGECSKNHKQRPGGTIRVTSLNCCKPDYEAFLRGMFSTELVEYGEGDQGHSYGKQVGWQGQCVDCGFFLRLEVKVAS